MEAVSSGAKFMGVCTQAASLENKEVNVIQFLQQLIEAVPKEATFKVTDIASETGVEEAFSRDAPFCINLLPLYKTTTVSFEITWKEATPYSRFVQPQPEMIS